MSPNIAIGVDVGGTKIAAAAVDIQSGEILMRDEIPTLRQQGGGRVLERLHDLVGTIHLEMLTKDIVPVGVGVGVPELVNNSGAITSGWNFDWDQRDIADRLAEFGDVILESDARTAALAEILLGHGKEFPSFVFITIGSGLSYAFCNNGQIHRGANGYAIHFGSNDIMALCSACGAQEGFNLEAFASGNGLMQTIRARTDLSMDTRELIDGSAGEAGERLLEQATNAMGSYLGQLVNILDPHAVVIGGGLGMAPKFFEALRGKVSPFIWAEDCRSIPIVRSGIVRDGATIGAALLFS